MKVFLKTMMLMSVSLSMLISCSSSWEYVDKKPFSEYKLHNALASCQFEKQRKASHPYYRAAHFGSEEHRKRMTELGDKIFKKAILCMKNKGFIKDGYNNWLNDHQHIKTEN